VRAAEVTPLSTPFSILPGQILLQKYRVGQLLGHGGMGAVFAGQHLALDERVAIKVLAPASVGDQDALARLQREARILARVRNEHVVRVIDLGQLEDGGPFMVMEHLTGRNLGRVLKEHGRLGVDVAVGYVLQVLIALAAAHTNGVVHRDLKPDNLFCAQSQKGTWLIKVLDFGISRLVRVDPSTSMTAPRDVMGTPLYMSPEQLRDSSTVDARSDIWSIGVVLYELVTGVSPFSGASIAEIAVKVATEQPLPLAAIDPSLSPELESVLSRCLRKERAERYANVAELARALLPFGPVGSIRLVERVERLAAESPISLICDYSCALPDVEPLVGPPPLSEIPAAVLGPGGVPARQRPGRLLPLLAVSGLLALTLAWRLIGPLHLAAAANRAAKPDSTGRNEQAPSAVFQEAPGLAATVSEPLAAPPLSGLSAPATHPANLGKNVPAFSSSPSLTLPPKDLCNPSYTIDRQGRKKFRHECFTERTNL